MSKQETQKQHKLTIVPVKLNERSYHVLIANQLRQSLHTILTELNIGKHITIITHPHLRTFYGNDIKEGLRSHRYNVDILEIDSGEASKSISHAMSLVSSLLEKKIERNHTIIALGGGVIGDLAGFVAAITLRGINLIQMPTTLLAQVDAAIGGKTGINHDKGKNLIGAFYQPLATISDIDMLNTLPKKEILAGLAEIVKYGVIFDESLFDYIEKHSKKLKDLMIKRDIKEWTYLIESSAKIKANIVSQDEREGNLRAILNFGHTIGHSIEKISGYGTFLHGEAVALGMKSASYIAQKMGLWKGEDHQRLLTVLTTLGFRLSIDPFDTDKLYEAILSDKKVQSNQVRFILPEKMGSVIIKPVTDVALIKESITYLYKQ